MHAMVARSVDTVEVRRIAPNDTNYFALLFDPQADHIDPVCVVEIFTVAIKLACIMRKRRGTV